MLSQVPSILVQLSGQELRPGLVNTGVLAQLLGPSAGRWLLGLVVCAGANQYWPGYPGLPETAANYPVWSVRLEARAHNGRRLRLVFSL